VDITSKMESVFQFAIHTSDVGHFAIYAGSIAILLLVFLMVQVLLARLRLVIVRQRRQRLQTIWRDIIGKILAGENPSIKRRDVFYIMEEFDYIFGLIRGTELERLQQGFRGLSLPISLKKILKSRNIKKRLFALITLGNIRDEDSWDLIVKNLAQSQPAISLSAARSLVLINPHRAVNEIVPILLNRKDWPWANIAHILKLAGPILVCKKLSEVILHATVSKQASLLRLYDVLKCEEAYPVTCKVLSQSSEDKVTSVCLNISRDPNILYLAREYARHERWHVRMNAAVAIGRFGHEEDIPLLVSLMKDSQWWVRYRAAQALLGLPCMDHVRVQQIRMTLNDKFADDIFVQALNERQYA